MYSKNTAIISACLMGFNCRYNCKNSLTHYIDVFLKKHNLVPLCPEQLGGLCTPRERAEITHGDGFYVINGYASVKTISGIDITNNFINGAKEVLDFVKSYNIKLAYFKEKSPSCGVNEIYIGGTLSKGAGVTTALLLENNIEVLGVK
jgi:uncharacterized protein YbbK (DUF523 family)